MRCCVTSNLPPPPPVQDYGKCFSPVQGKMGVCKDTALCLSPSVATPGFCPGANNIQCCTAASAGSLGTPVFAPAVAVGTYGACASSATGTAGTCKASGSCSTGTNAAAGLCSYAPSGTVCCNDEGPLDVAGSLPGGSGLFVSSGSGDVAAQAACIQTAGSSYIVARGWTNKCKLDEGVIATLAAAATAGLKADVMMTPSNWCGVSAKAQAYSLMASLVESSAVFGRIWLQVLPSSGSGWSVTNTAPNVQWVLDAADALVAQLGSARVGIITSSAGWTTVTANAAAANRLGSLPLWYVGSTSTTDFADFAAFGGWTFPKAKLYPGLNSATVCGLTSTTGAWFPVRSTTPATAGSAPAPEAQGPACSFNGNAGFCQSLGACSNSTAVAASCTGSTVCCLSGALTRPAEPEPAASLPLSYGYCYPNATGQPGFGMTGICQPSAQCGVGDLQVTGVAGCAADPDADPVDVNVLCCVPSTPLPMPPTDEDDDDDSLNGMTASVRPSLLHALANAIPVPTPMRRVTSVTTTSTPADRLCINKAGLALIENYEGFRANFYLDAVGSFR